FEAVEVVPSRVFGHLTKVRLQPITGRTHQLRIHLSNAGHPIVGDKLYLNDQKSILGKGVLLCAAELRFAHPVTGKSVELRVEVPGKFDRILKREADRFR
ncbi:MAG: RluA family pseudouridine synthase, partial [Bacteroidota bacterium]